MLNTWQPSILNSKPSPLYLQTFKTQPSVLNSQTSTLVSTIDSTFKTLNLKLWLLQPQSTPHSNLSLCPPNWSRKKFATNSLLYRLYPISTQKRCWATQFIRNIEMGTAQTKLQRDKRKLFGLNDLVALSPKLSRAPSSALVALYCVFTTKNVGLSGEW